MSRTQNVQAIRVLLMKSVPHGCMNDTPTPKIRRTLHEDLDGTYGLVRVFYGQPLLSILLAGCVRVNITATISYYFTLGTYSAND